MKIILKVTLKAIQGILMHRNMCVCLCVPARVNDSASRPMYILILYIVGPTVYMLIVYIIILYKIILYIIIVNIVILHKIIVKHQIMSYWVTASQ